ncbi:MAG: TraB/GumN family protein [Thermodesulfobacteriota bacterium]
MPSRRLPRRFFAFLFIALFLWPAVCPAKTSLWQVRAGSHVLYLLGSLHVLQESSYPLPALMEEVYQASSTLAFETDLDAINSPAMQRKILSYGTLPAGQRLSQVITPPTRELVQRRIIALGMKSADIERLRPWLAALTLTVRELERQGFAARYGLDSHFFQRAKRDGKKIVPLESADFQLSLFYSQSRREQEDFLRQSLQDLHQAEKQAGELERAWRSGDETALAAMITTSFAGYSGQFKRLVLDRNRNWLPVLEKLMQEEEATLVVVGVGHLVGEGSLVALLRAKGYVAAQR